MTVEIRLHGTEDECREAAARLPALGEVLSVSRPYPDHGASRLVRVFAKVRPGQSAGRRHRGLPAKGVTR